MTQSPPVPSTEPVKSSAGVESIEQTREGLREEARKRIGISGKHDAPPMLKTMREHNVSMYPLLALGVLAIMDGWQAYGFGILGPELSRALGISIAGLAGVRALRMLVGIGAPFLYARLTQNRPRRAMLCIVGAAGWSAMTFANGLVLSVTGLIIVLLLDGFFGETNNTVARPLLMDLYPPPLRVRVLSAYASLNQLGGILGPFAVFVSAGIFDLTWRGVFIVMGTISLLGFLFTIGLRDPGFGKWDTNRIRDAVHEAHGESTSSHQLSSDDVQLGFFEIFRRLLLVPTVRRIGFGFMVFGILTIPFGTVLAFFLDEKGLDAGDRGLFGTVMSGVSIAVLMGSSKWGEKLFRQNPGQVANYAGLTLSGALVCMTLAIVSPFLIGTLIFFALSQGLIALLTPQFGIVMLSVVEAAWRPHIGAVLGVFLAAGALAGVLLLGGVVDEFGVGGAMVALMIPGVIGAFVIRSTKDLVQQDMDRMVDDVLEDEELKRMKSSGQRLPMLACRKIDFSYGSLQVLFGVDFTVDEGELVALLGTNGSGKSTLLKVISGLGLPSTGTVRYRGQDITYIDAERRVRLGISQIPGGKAVFGSMNVVDNMRGYAYTLGRNRKAVDEAIERSFEAFPRLYERRNSLASTLSGGEQQMLGLTQAFILQPRVLLIDELSLGLAPIIVGQLLDVVREINANGTAVVVVEQSVNIAMELANHAYFMEKGQIRFDGPTKELVGRSDLLRAVFLEGVDKGMTNAQSQNGHGSGTP